MRGVLLVLLLAGCATTQPVSLQAQADAATFVIVRHAEKAADGSADPALAPAGVERARALARRLASEPLVAAYATPFRRTRLTAQPAAGLHGIPVTLYDAARPAPDFAASLRRAYSRGTVLVVGHSNTAPAIASALCGCEVAPMAEDDYDAIYVVRLHSDGTSSLQAGRQSQAAP
ncbi:MAG: phosphoglycerate mutase family protein [Luteimonas sp.]